MPIDCLDVVTTAMPRPELLELTYRSFYNHLFSRIKHCRLIINIDPGPASANNDQKTETMLTVCRKWFPEVVYRCPSTPSFPAAVQWAWSQVETDIFFHLEDDWLLLNHIDPVRIDNYFNASPRLAEVTLNPSINRSTIPGLALRPSFFRRAFVTAALPLFDETLDPEKQWHRHLASEGALNQWCFRYYGETGEGRDVKDMGALWRKVHALEKWGAGQVTWKQGNDSAWQQQLFRMKLSFYMAVWSRHAGEK